MLFDNKSSTLGFIGNYTSVDEVVELDKMELQEISGSFEAIAGRMREIVEFAMKNSRYLPKKIDNKIEVFNYVTTRGEQQCPFEGCDFEGRKIPAWNENVLIIDLLTGKELVINSGTEHLARVHNLLEKGNKYGVSAKEFYEHFM